MTHLLAIRCVCTHMCTCVQRQGGKEEREKEAKVPVCPTSIQITAGPLNMGTRDRPGASALHCPMLKTQTAFPENSPDFLNCTFHNTQNTDRPQFPPETPLPTALQEAISHSLLTFTQTPPFDTFVTTTSFSRTLTTPAAPVCCLQASAPHLRGLLRLRRAGEDKVTVGSASSR